MYVSVRHYENVSRVDEICRRVEHDFVPLLRKAPGFIAYYAVDGGDGSFATISVFSTAEMAKESNDTAAVWVRENVAELQPDPPEIVSGKAKVVATA